jgi:hypothetical protein
MKKPPGGFVGFEVLKNVPILFLSVRFLLPLSST